MINIPYVGIMRQSRELPCYKSAKYNLLVHPMYLGACSYIPQKIGQIYTHKFTLHIGLQMKINIML